LITANGVGVGAGVGSATGRGSGADGLLHPLNSSNIAPNRAMEKRFMYFYLKTSCREAQHCHSCVSIGNLVADNSGR
jgi:hypothetical protein